MTTLRRAFIAMSITWAALLPLAPFAASQAAPARLWYGLAFIVYGAGSFICHQLPARSFHTWAAQWPVCARCTGIYFGSAAAAIVASRSKSKYVGSGFLGPPKPRSGEGGSRTAGSVSRIRVLLMIAALPTAVTLIYEWTTGGTPSNMIRALAGAPLGAAVALVVVEALRDSGCGQPVM